MPPLYKEGLYWLILLAITATAYLVLAIFLGPIPALGAFGLLGFSGIQPLLYRDRQKEVLWDERDTLVAYRAVLVAYSIFWLVFTLGVMGLWTALFYGGRETVSVQVLPAMVMGGFIVFMTARALAIVVQYRRKASGKEE